MRILVDQMTSDSLVIAIVGVVMFLMTFVPGDDGLYSPLSRQHRLSRKVNLVFRALGVLTILIAIVVAIAEA